MLARNLPGICSEFARNSLGKLPGPAMRRTLQFSVLLGGDEVDMLGSADSCPLHEGRLGVLNDLP